MGCDHCECIKEGHPCCHGCSTTCPGCGCQACNDHFNPMEQLCIECLAERDGTPPAKGVE